jgi:hyperosmotically inducible protein
MSLSHDKYIGDRVERRLIRSASLAGTDIRVAVENRIVSLSGAVGSEQDKERALQIARKTKGVKEAALSTCTKALICIVI